MDQPLNVMGEDTQPCEGDLIKLSLEVLGVRIFLKEDKGSEERFLLCTKVCKQ